MLGEVIKVVGTIALIGCFSASIQRCMNDHSPIISSVFSDLLNTKSSVFGVNFYDFIISKTC